VKPAILVLTSTYPRWLADVEPGFVHELSRRLAQDYEVHVLAPHCRGALTGESIDGVHVHRFRYFFVSQERLAYEGGMLTKIQRYPWLLLILPFFLLSLLHNTCRISRKYKITLIHAHWVIPQGFVAMLFRIFRPGIPLVLTSHGGDVYGLNGWFLNYLKRTVYGKSDVITVVSNAMASDLRAFLVAADIRLAPMGVDLRERFIAKMPLESRRDVVFVGRLVEKKGVSVLLDAFAQLKPAYPELRLTIVGDGPARASLERQALKLGIEGAVEFIGAVSNTEVPGVLNQYGIAVVPSVIAASGDQEGLGLVAIEAMGCGCALLAADLPALRDIVDHGRNGLLFEVGNANALAASLQRLLDNEELRIRLASAGRAGVLQKFDWEQAAGKYRNIFADLIQHSGSKEQAGP
jgi:glycosyltransferase involved in cell wall biosynthesis